MEEKTEVKYGITNIIPLVMLGVEIGNVADKMGHTRGMARYMHLTGLFDEAIALGMVDFKQVKLEIKDLDNVEMEQIKQQVKIKFDIIDDDLEGVIEEAIEIIEDISSSVVRSITLAQKIKALKNKA